MSANVRRTVAAVSARIVSGYVVAAPVAFLGGWLLGSDLLFTAGVAACAFGPVILLPLAILSDLDSRTV